MLDTVCRWMHASALVRKPMHKLSQPSKPASRLRPPEDTDPKRMDLEPLLRLQMAARDTGLGAVEQFMHQGKLLALDLLTHVFNDPGHNWALSRPSVRPFWGFHETTASPSTPVSNDPRNFKGKR